MKTHYCKVGTVRPNSNKVISNAKALNNVISKDNMKKVSYFSKLAK